MLQKEREKLLLIFLVPVIIWACYYRKVYKPRRREVRRLRTSTLALQREIFKAEDELPRIDLEVKKLRQIQAQCEDMEKEIISYQRNFFGRSEIPSLIQLLAGDAGRGFELVCMKADKLKKRDFYRELPIRISFTSDYAGLLKYLRRLEPLSPLIRVSNLHLSSDGASINTHLIAGVILGEADFGEVKLPEIVSAPPLPEGIHDPFVSVLGKDSTVSEVRKPPALRLQGIIWGGEELKTAVINGEVLRVGQKIDNKELVEIHKDRVLLREGDRETFLLLKDFDKGD